jgi:hypothetical protein
VAEYTTVIPGLPGGPLVSSFRVGFNIIPASRTYQRPGIKLRGTFDTTQHATDNTSSNAPGEAAYFAGGAEGRQASVHAIADESVVMICLPLDEVGWHASDGAGPGNMSTVACELTMRTSLVNNAALWRIARRNAAEFMGRVAARKAADNVPSFHRTYAPDRKWCPSILLNNATWMAEYISDYKAFYADEKKRMAGGGAGEVIDDGIINIGDTLRAIVPLNLRQSASTSAPVIGTLLPGTDVIVNGRWESADGYGWLPVATPLGDGTVAQGDATGPYLEKIKDAPKPEPEPEYVPVRPIPALLDTDVKKYDTAEGITADDTGNEFIFVADVLEFTEETVAGEFALPDPRKVKRNYKAGERAIGAWLVKAKQDGQWYYVLTGGDDEWVRVPYANTKRISDAPLLGGEWETTEPATDAA